MHNTAKGCSHNISLQGGQLSEADDSFCFTSDKMLELYIFKLHGTPKLLQFNAMLSLQLNVQKIYK